MSDERDSTYKFIIDRAFNEAVSAAVQEIIARNVGSGIDSDIKQAIRDEARRLIKEDPEIRQAIRAGHIHVTVSLNYFP